MEKKEVYKRHPRRQFTGSLTVPDSSLDIRVLINRTAKGLPINAKVSKHIPLPPDGMVLEDFDSGMEEITDVTDMVEFADKLNAERKHIAEQRQKALEEANGVEIPTTAPEAK